MLIFFTYQNFLCAFIIINSTYVYSSSWVCFDISNYVITVYGLRLEDVPANDRNLNRHDKIENTRPNHHPLTVVRCYSLKETHNVKMAIGPGGPFYVDD